MYHSLAFFKALANVADTDIPALNDDIIPIQAGHFILPSPMQLLMAYASAVTLVRAKIVTPTMRQVANPYIRPINANLLPGTNTNLQLFKENRTVLVAYEETAIQMTDSAVGPNNAYCILTLSTGNQPIPAGNVYPLRWTSTTAAVVQQWTTLALTFEQVIPSGRYAVIFSEHFSTNAIWHRIIFSGQMLRPGLPSQAADTGRTPYRLDPLTLGMMGVFRSNDLPRVQVMCDAADAVHEGYMWAVRIGDLDAGPNLY